jgi:peptidylprolyl isomerase
MRRTALTLLVLAACSPEAAPDRPETASDAASEAPAATTPLSEARLATDPRELAFAAELAVDLDAMELRPSGLYVQVLREGEGPAAALGDRMGVAYTVWLPDGRKLDSSFDHTPPAPYSLVLGQTPLIDGWVEGVTGMRRGEKRRLVVPYDLAYGAAGRPPAIPAYSTLVFEVELAEHEPAEAS